MEQERCSAKVTYRDIKHSVQRFVHDFEGRRVDLGASIKEEPGIGERTVSCAGCNIHETLTAEGMGRPI